MSLTSCMFSKNKLGIIRVCNGFVACTSVLDVCCSSSSAQLAAAKIYGFVFEVSGGDFLVDGSNASSIQFKVDEETVSGCTPERKLFNTQQRHFVRDLWNHKRSKGCSADVISKHSQPWVRTYDHGALNAGTGWLWEAHIQYIFQQPITIIPLHSLFQGIGLKALFWAYGSIFFAFPSRPSRVTLRPLWPFKCWGGAVPFLRAAGKPVDSENLKICAGLATARECIAGAKSVVVLRCPTHMQRMFWRVCCLVVSNMINIDQLYLYYSTIYS